MFKNKFIKIIIKLIIKNNILLQNYILLPGDPKQHKCPPQMNRAQGLNTEPSDRSKKKKKNFIQQFCLSPVSLLRCLHRIDSASFCVLCQNADSLLASFHASCCSLFTSHLDVNMEACTVYRT